MDIGDGAAQLRHAHVNHLIFLGIHGHLSVRGGSGHQLFWGGLRTDVVCDLIVCLFTNEAALTERLLAVDRDHSIENELEPVLVPYRHYGLDKVAELAIGCEIHVHPLWEPVIPFAHHHDVVKHLRGKIFNLKCCLGWFTHQII
jgi:hypothetical protein